MPTPPGPTESNTSGSEPLLVGIRPWADGDLPLMERIMGDPLMTQHLVGPESPEKLRDRHQRYLRSGIANNDHMFVIVVGSERLAAGSVGYWEKQWHGQGVWESGWHVLPEFQGRGLATRATALVVERARAEGRHRFLHAFPSVENGASNSVCRRLGFTLQGAVDFEFPLGRLMRCNDWRLDLFGDSPEATAP